MFKKFVSVFVIITLCISFFSSPLGGTLQANALGPWDTFSDTWTATDDLGRVVPTYEQVGPLDNTKVVGMFYSLWHNNLTYNANTDPGPFNVTQILKNNPSAIGNPNSPPWGPWENNHFWAEPLFGYYDLTTDDYVLKRHAQMLSDAGVDVLFFDFSNYTDISGDRAALLNLCEVFTEVRNAGGKTPQISFLYPFNDASTKLLLTSLYTEFYSKNLYPDLWFRWQGKPFALASNAAVTDSNILNFFTFRKNNPAYGAPTQSNSWGWLTNYPQEPYYTSGNPREELCVSVAQNALASSTSDNAFYPFANQDASGRFNTRGRSFHNGSEPLYTNPMSSSYSSASDLNFQEQWSRGLEVDPSIIFIVGWNEWMAGRWHSVGPTSNSWGVFCDLFTPEFSRDIEPSIDSGLGDNTYNLLARYIRQYKGATKPTPASGVKTISIDGSFADWADVMPEFRDDIGDKAVRNSKGLGSAPTYTNTTGRNDYKLMKVARDSNNIYFYVETVDNISSYTDSNWMRLLIKTNSTDPNWKGYNYIVNRTGVTATGTTLEKSTGNWNWTTANSNIQYKISGNKMELVIPRASLGLGSSNVDIQFKWNDNMQNQGNVNDFYTNGDSAPNERFNYRYMENQSTLSYTENLYSAIGSHSPQQLTGSNTAGMKFTANKPFNSIDVACPSWANNVGNLTLKLYKWTSDYNSSIAGTPIHTQTFTNYTDNAWLKINFSIQGKGDYIWVLSNPVENVGVWKYTSSDTASIAYLNGTATTGDFQSRVYYYETPQAAGEVSRYTEDLFSEIGSHSPQQLTGTNTAAMRFTAKNTFESIDVACPSWANNIGNLTLKLYKWNSDYNTTLAGTPVHTQTFTNYTDNAWLKINFATQAKGDYLWILSNPVETVGVWKYASSDAAPTSYLNGAVTTGDYQSRVYYVETP